MKTINETFTDEEFQKLQTVKGEKSWHDFVLKLVDRRKQPKAKLTGKEGN
jgi:predicted CopG family antitoxin